jgi:hypothetical protein
MEYIPHAMFIKQQEFVKGRLVQEGDWVGNTLLTLGRARLGEMITGLATGSASAGFVNVCAGPSGLPSVTVGDDRLGGTLASHASAYEWIANGNRKPLLSAATDAPIVAADWVDDTVTVGSNTYYKSLTAYVEYDESDANATVPGTAMRRYGLNNVLLCPATASGLSGLMFNEVEDTVTLLNKTTNVIRVNVILRA